MGLHAGSIDTSKLEKATPLTQSAEHADHMHHGWETTADLCVSVSWHLGPPCDTVLMRSALITIATVIASGLGGRLGVFNCLLAFILPPPLLPVQPCFPP